jgi:tyrosyl-tRNA synthetase
MKAKSEVLHTLIERGFLYQCSNLEELDNLFLRKSVKGYIGFDCTADSLHVGSLVQIMMLRTLKRFGHKPVVVVGSGTSLIGDPSGRDESRSILTVESILKNAEGIKNTLSQFLENVEYVNNADWLTKLNYLEFLRDYGYLFTVNKMLTFDSVKQRLEREQPLTFLEFNYILLQAFDFLHLFKNLEVELQMGGSDQWGNIINGTELIRKSLHKQAFGLTSPLITTSDGKKMGKTANGAVWLSPDKLSSFEYYQFFRNVNDLDVERFLKLFTEIQIKEINKLVSLRGKEINEAKKILAFEAVKIAHSEKHAKMCVEIAKKNFEENVISDNMTSFVVDLTSGKLLVDLICDLKLLSSKTEAKRLILSGGIKINDEKIEDVFYIISKILFNGEKQFKLTIGKKKIVLIKF